MNYPLGERATLRIKSKAYLKWVSTLPCSECKADNDTVVAHHLKGRYAPLSGGMGYKADDWLTMPLCFTCHSKIHSGDAELMNWQAFFILKTLDKAFDDGIIEL